MTESVARPVPIGGDAFQLVRDWDAVGEERAGLVLIHGLGDHSGRFSRTASLLAEAGYRVRAFDWLGHGASSGRRGHIDHWGRFLDQIEGHIEAMAAGKRPVVLLGHSVGALLALDYVLSERPSPNLLVLSAPFLRKGRYAWQRFLLPIMARLFPTLSVPITVDPVTEFCADPTVGEDYVNDPLVLRKATLRLYGLGFGTIDRVLANIDALDIPTLVVHGGLDEIATPPSIVPLERLPKVERKLYPKLHHELFNEAEGPQVVADVIKWIDEKLP